METMSYKPEILNILKNENCYDEESGITARKIAQECGLIKATDKINRELRELVEEQSIKIGTNERNYNCYFIDLDKDEYDDEEFDDEYDDEEFDGDDGDDDDGDESVDSANVEIPGFTSTAGTKLPSSDFGYSVLNHTDDSRFDFRIVAPDGATVDIIKTEKVIVINPGTKQEERMIVDSIDNIFTAIEQYAIERQIGHYLVDDICTHKTIRNEKYFDESAIIYFLSVKRHNKAAY